MKHPFLWICTLMIQSNMYGQTLIRPIRPGDTDPLITTFNTDSHYVYLNPAQNPQNLLLVHLPGSFGEPKRSTLFSILAADLGFHSIGLMYPNIPTVGSFCSNSSDPNCFENVRKEIVEGIDYSSDLTIALEESILSRLRKLLLYLVANHPSENWDQFLDSNQVLVFEKIIFSGHSQGGGHAALIGKLYPVKRIIGFSSPKDWSNVYNQPPNWLSPNGWVTPPGKIYCFNHVLDEQVRQTEIWDSLGIDAYGQQVDVIATGSPYLFSRQLTTSYQVPAGDEHASTIQDNKTPKIAGEPVFLPVWNYLLTNQLNTSVSENDQQLPEPISIYPNPNSGKFFISLKSENCSLKIADLNGKVILESAQLIPHSLIDLSFAESGVYLLQITNSSFSFKSKIILK